MLHRTDGDLFIEQVSLHEIAENYGTPTFVYSADEITRAYQEFDQAFANHPHQVCYSVKANSNIAVLQLLAELGSGFDIVSGGELERVIAAGGDPAKTIFSGVGKQDWEIEKALTAGIACFNVESESEFDRLVRIAREKDVIAPISVRVNPDVDANTHPYIATGLKENKFGVSAKTALDIYRSAKDEESVTIVGIDCHIGSQITTVEPFLEALDCILALADQLGNDGITISHIDLGGGIGVRYQDEDIVDVSTFASAILQAMSGRSETLMFEPGRLIVANAGLLLTRVNTLKTNEGTNFAIVDAAMNDLIRPALYEAWQDVSAVTQREKGQSQSWDLVGPVCESGDFLAKARELTLEENDLIAIHSAGAYGFVMSSNYNTRGRAAEVMVTQDQHFAIRRRETIDDQLQLESLKPK